MSDIASQVNAVLRYRVEVEEQLLRIAYESGVHALTISWGAAEIDHRYEVAALRRWIEPSSEAGA